MAWNIPQELMNNNPLDKKIVKDRLIKKGYIPVNDDFEYKNNMTPIDCYNKDGYIVKVKLSALDKDFEFMPFRYSCNSDNFLYNAEVFEKKNDLDSHIIEVLPRTNNKEHLKVKCICKCCDNEFITDFNSWHRMTKTRCNNCNRVKSKIERLTEEWLIENNIEYIWQYKFDDCVDKRCLPFDFYLPKYNCCIEVDGDQHYKRSSRFYIRFKTKEEADKRFTLIQKHDNIKTNYCKDNKINLIRLKNGLFNNSKTYTKVLSKALLS